MPTAAEQLQGFLARRPADASPGDFDLTSGRGRRLYDDAKKKAVIDQNKWDADNKDTLADLRESVRTEKELAKTALSTQQRREQAQQR
jgi:hypothetical protein